LQGDGTKDGTKDCADLAAAERAWFELEARPVRVAPQARLGRRTPGELVADLGRTVRALIAAGPPPLPGDLLADLLRLAAAAAGNGATRAGVEAARVANTTESPSSELEVRREG
jgi:hypothetical protein